MSDIRFTPGPGANIRVACNDAVRMAALLERPVTLTFNGTEVRVNPQHTDTLEALWRVTRDLDQVRRGVVG